MTLPADLDPRLARMAALLAGQGLMAHLGIVVDGIAPGRVTLGLPIRPELHQHAGYVHGGAIGTLADVACAGPAGTLLDDRSYTLTTEYKINFLAPALGQRLVAHGAVVRPGRTTTVVEARVFAQDRGAETMCAIALATIAIRQVR